MVQPFWPSPHLSPEQKRSRDSRLRQHPRNQFPIFPLGYAQAIGLQSPSAPYLDICLSFAMIVWRTESSCTFHSSFGRNNTVGFRPTTHNIKFLHSTNQHSCHKQVL